MPHNARERHTQHTSTRPSPRPSSHDSTLSGYRAHSATVIQRALASPRSLTADAAQYLQRTLGNQRTSQLLARGGELDTLPRREADNAPLFTQAKLEISQPGDRHEQEADRFANAAMDPHAWTLERGAPIGALAPGAVRSGQLAVAGENLHGGGHPLPEHDRHFFESRLGHNLGDVRLHTDVQAARAAQALSAHAFTHGRDVYFGAGKFQPHEAQGRRLLAHELAHTVQQAAVPAGARALPIMRQPLSGEDAAAYKARQEVLEDAKATIKSLEQCLAKNTPCHAEESITSSGEFTIKGWGGVTLVESKATHDARLTQLVADLKDIQREFASAQIPAGALGQVEHLVAPQGPQQIFSGLPIANLYVRRAYKQGPTYATALTNTLYIDHVIEKKRKPTPTPAKPKKQPPPPQPRTTVAPPTHFEEDTGYHLVVPDPKNAPLVYRPLTKYGDNRGHILNIRRDEGGYFYRGHQNQKIYLPSWQPHPEGL